MMASRKGARKRADKSRAEWRTHVERRDTAAPARERAMDAIQNSWRRRERAPSAHGATLHEREATTETRAEGERLIGRLREANERLIVAAVRAQTLSEVAHAEAARARLDLEGLIRQLRDANGRLAIAALKAQAMAEEASRHEEEYRGLSGRLLQLQDEERRRLAVDLHDSTGQSLAALTMNLDLVRRAGKMLNARSRRALTEGRSLAAQCSRQVRTFAYLLHPPLLDEVGLAPAVRWYGEGFTERSGVQVMMNLGKLGRLPQPIETALFRVVQESLTNIHRHASASTASIRLTRTANAVVLEIRDQGHGLRQVLPRQHGELPPGALGVGIQGMRERIVQLGGTFDIAFTKTGTKVRVEVPVAKEAP
jgi:signal transduction histidine kinase